MLRARWLFFFLPCENLYNILKTHTIDTPHIAALFDIMEREYSQEVTIHNPLTVCL